MLTSLGQRWSGHRGNGIPHPSRDLGTGERKREGKETRERRVGKAGTTARVTYEISYPGGVRYL